MFEAVSSVLDVALAYYTVAIKPQSALVIAGGRSCNLRRFIRVWLKVVG